MANNIIEGSDLMLFLGGKSIAFATSHKLSISAETTETSSKDNGGSWKSSKVKKLSWTASSDNLYSEDGYEALVTQMVAKTEIQAVFAPKSETADEVPTTGWTPTAATGYTGKVIITSIEANAPDGDNATFSVSFEGVGALTKVTAA